MKRWLGTALPLALLVLGSCIVIKPPEKPIHLIVDVNLRIQVQKDLDEFFNVGDETEETKEPEAKPEA